MLMLTQTTHSLELVTLGAGQIDWNTVWADHTTLAFTPDSNQGTVNAAATTSIIAAPAASTQRQIKYISVRNRSGGPVTVYAQKNVSGTTYRVSPDVALNDGEVLEYLDGQGFRVLDPFAKLKASIEAEITNETVTSVVEMDTLVEQNVQIIALLSAAVLHLAALSDHDFGLDTLPDLETPYR